MFKSNAKKKSKGFFLPAGGEVVVPVVVFFVVALGILLPLLFSTGYILSLDMWGVPKLAFSSVENNWTSPFLFRYASHFIANLIVPGFLLQRLQLLLLLVCIGVFFCLSLPKSHPLPTRLAVSLFYLVNPFVYERFMAGHTMILWGYALFPLVLRVGADFFTKEHSTWRDSLLLVGVTSLMLWCDVHYVSILLVPMLVGGIVFFPRVRDRVLQTPFAVLEVLVGFLVLNSFWIIPPFFAATPFVERVASFTSSHLQTFSPIGDHWFGLYPNLLGLYGFWRGNADVLLPKDFLLGWWFPLFLVLLVPVMIGVFFAPRMLPSQRKVVVFLVLSGVFAVVLAAGSHFPLNQWLFDHVFLYRGMREPQKYIGLLAYVYAVLALLGFQVVGHWVKKRPTLLYDSLIAFAVVTIVYTYTFFWGASGQLQPVAYPETWTRTEQVLQADKRQNRLLVLPWRLYLELPFNNRFSINPASAFFSEKVLYSKRMRMENIALHEEYFAPEEEEVEQLLDSDDVVVWQDGLEDLGVTHVLINKVENFFWYPFLRDGQIGEVIAEDQYAFLIEVER